MQPTPTARRKGPRVPVPGKVDAAGRPVTRLPDGTVLAGRYELTFLAAGGMGAVYVARDGGTGVEVIIKEAFSKNPDDHAMVIVALTQERETLIRLNHPGIVRALDFFIENGACYLVLEYLRGKTLQSLIEAGQRLTETEAVDIALQVCDALEHVHGHHLVYRDLKPENLMVTAGPDGRRLVKLIDFGTARLHKPGQQKDTSALGTVGFAPPEQFGSGQTDERSDIYSLGATLHYVLTGRHPDEAPFSFPPLRTLNASVSPELEAIVEQAVQGTPDRRFAGIGPMRTALLGTRKGCPVCGAANRAKSKFCIACGQPLSGAGAAAGARGPGKGAPAAQPPTTMVGAGGAGVGAGQPPTSRAGGQAPTSMAGGQAPTTTGGVQPPSAMAGGQPPTVMVGQTAMVGGGPPMGPPPVGPPPTMQVAKAPLPTGGTTPPPPPLAGGVQPPPLAGPRVTLVPTPKPLGRVVRVDASGRGDYTRITDALNVARDGDVIEVAGGTYMESLSLTERVVLKGAGPDRTRIVSTSERPVLDVYRTDGAWVEGFTLEYSGTRPNCVAWVRQSRVILQNNHIRGATLSGVEYGDGSSGEVRGNVIEGNRQTGIFVHSHSNVSIYANHIHSNGLDSNTAGIEVREQSQVVIEGNLVQGNGIGLYVHEQSSPVVRGNTIVGNGLRTEFMAVEVKGGSAPIIEGNLIQDNSGGILIKERSQPRVIGNHILRNGVDSGGPGIEILEASAPVIEGNLVEGNGSGIGVRDGSRPRLRRNQVIGNGQGRSVSALEIGDASQVVADHNLIARNAAGILIHGGSQCQLLDNVVVENGLQGGLTGIEVRGQSDAVVFHNLVLHNGGAGIWFHQSSTGEVENNIVLGNLRGVVVDQSRRAPLSCGYNNVWANKRDYVGLGRPGTDISADPLFVDESTWDFRLYPHSPAAISGRGHVAQGPRGA